MYKGKHSYKNKRRLTSWAALAIALVLTLSVGGTIAYLATNTSAITNTFTPSNVDCEVKESFDGTTKTDVKIQNTGDTAAYIRATVVVNWITNDDKVCINHSADVTITPAGSSWEKGSEGYYYYTKPVVPNGFTEELISNEVVLKQDNDGCKMQVTILAQAIQSEPADAVTEAWGFVPDN